MSLFFALFSKETLFSTAVEFALLALEGLTLVCLFIGIKKSRSKFLLPFIVYSLLSCLFTVFLLVFTTIAIVNPDSWFGTWLKVRKRSYPPNRVHF